MTYEQGIETIERLLNQLQTTNSINPIDNTEYAMLHDSLTSYICDLKNELRRQNLIKEFNQFNKKI